MTCRLAPAGFVSGPSRLNTVRIPSSRRTGAACFMAGWWRGANMKPETELVDGFGDPLGRELNVETQCFENVRRP